MRCRKPASSTPATWTWSSSSAASTRHFQPTRFPRQTSVPCLPSRFAVRYNHTSDSPSTSAWPCCSAVSAQVSIHLTQPGNNLLCPGCGTGYEIQDPPTKATRGRCSGCGRLLVIVDGYRVDGHLL